jgi:hypothetical protein
VGRAPHPFPAGDVPLVELGLPMVPAAQLLRFGEALRPLRDSGMLVVVLGQGARAWAADAERLAALGGAALDRWRDASAELDAAPAGLAPLLVAAAAAGPAERLQWLHRGQGADRDCAAWLPAPQAYAGVAGAASPPG